MPEAVINLTIYPVSSQSAIWLFYIILLFFNQTKDWSYQTLVLKESSWANVSSKLTALKTRRFLAGNCFIKCFADFEEKINILASSDKLVDNEQYNKSNPGEADCNDVIDAKKRNLL